MALSILELNQLAQDLILTDPFSNWRQRDDELHFRSIHVKHDPQLEWLRDFYPRKIERLIQYYNRARQGYYPIPESELESYLFTVESKLRRIAVKLRDTLLEIRGRELDTISRNPIGTTYYIDLDSGNNSNDGLTTGNAWLTLEQYLSTTVRSPGDIALIRAGTSETVGAANIVADEDGSGDSLIYVIGCDDGDNDPWNDNSTTRPIIDFNGGNYGILLDTDYFWRWENMEVKGSAYNTWNGGQFGVAMAYYFELINCKIQEAQHASGAYGFRAYGYTRFLIEDCIFTGNRNIGFRLDSGANGIIRRSTFDGGGTYGQDWGIYASGGCRIRIEDSQFGQTSAHDSGDIESDTGSDILCIKSTTRDVSVDAAMAYGRIRYQDHTWSTGTRSANTLVSMCQETSKQTGVVRSGGSAYSLQLLPRTNFQYPANYILSGLSGSGMNEDGWPLRMYMTAEAHTVTMYVRADSAFSTYPTAEELFLEVTYEGADPYDLTTVVSDEVISDGSTWVGLSVTFTPGRAGFVYADVKCGVYESGRSIYLDPMPVVT